jgi:hypothetical protein
MERTASQARQPGHIDLRMTRETFAGPALTGVPPGALAAPELGIAGTHRPAAFGSRIGGCG